MVNDDGPDLDTVIENMRDEHLQCRDFGHSWRPFHVKWKEGDSYNRNGYYESQLRCTRCRTRRFRYMTITGEQIGSHYDYADGYTTKGLGRLTGEDRDHIRLASKQRVMLPKEKKGS